MKNYIILTRIGWAAAAGWLSSPWTALLKARCRFSRSPSISKSTGCLAGPAHTNSDRQQAGKTPASVNFFQNLRNTFLYCYFIHPSVLFNKELASEQINQSLQKCKIAKNWQQKCCLDKPRKVHRNCQFK